MALQITRGVQRAAIRAIIYGVEGIGKTSLAVALPDTVILDTEDGSLQIDCARIRISHATRLTEAIRELTTNPQGFKTVVIDTADWAERLITDNLCQRAGVKSVEFLGGGWGKGYTFVREEFDKLLMLLDGLIEKGINVVFVAHSTVKRVSPPDQTDGFDRYELKLSKHVSPLLKEWSDLVLFCNYKIRIVEGEDGRMKAEGGTERVMFTSRTAAWDAKNRFGLEPELPMEAAQILHLFSGVPPLPKPAAPPPVTPDPALATGSQEGPPPAEAITPAQLKGLREAMGIQDCKTLIETTLELEGLQSIEGMSKDLAARVITDLKPIVQAHRAKLKAATTPAATTPPKADPAPADTTATPAGSDVKTPFPPSVVAKVEPHSDKVTTYMRGRGFITAEQTWRDSPPEWAEKLINRTDAVLRAAGVVYTS